MVAACFPIFCAAVAIFLLCLRAARAPRLSGTGRRRPRLDSKLERIKSRGAHWLDRERMVSNTEVWFLQSGCRTSREKFNPEAGPSFRAFCETVGIHAPMFIHHSAA